MTHDVAIYAPLSRGYYDRSRGRSGGAERQMMLLARALAARGHQVAHIVYPPDDPFPLPERLMLVHREEYAGGLPVVGGIRETMRIWRALGRADGRVVVVRTGGPVLGVALVNCRLRRRPLIFSSSNNSDFTLERVSNRLYRALYRLGVRLADVVVVQSQDQHALSRQAFPSQRRLVHIPSFAEPAPSASVVDPPPPEAFLWFGRFVPYKQPLRYVELARSIPDARFIMIAVRERGDPWELDELRSATRDVPNLELRKPIPHDQLRGLIARSVAVVNSSTAEGMPNSFLEAWAQGVPVLTLQFDPDGVVAQHGLGIAAAGSWDRFVAGARTLWEERDQREKLWSKTREYVERVHSIEAVGSRWSDLVRELTHGA